MNELQNTRSRVAFRQSILKAQDEIDAAVANGQMAPVLQECVLAHYFTPIDPKYKCATYARQFFMPKGAIVIGKIHKHQHLNFIMQGRVSVSTEFGVKQYEAPCVFVSEVGLKRAVFALTDCLWVTIHLTEHAGEENLDKIEDEVIAKDYGDLGLIADVAELDRIGESL